jgi:Holliday junction resolvasome RuvABC endonuclease subunit
MATAKRQARQFEGMSYRAVQRVNSKNQATLPKADQKWLKANGYKNVGWESVIALYQKIQSLIQQYEVEQTSLEDLFLEADRIGNKYLTAQEIADFNQRLAEEVEAIAELVDQQFPDTEAEMIDFSRGSRP